MKKFLFQLILFLLLFSCIDFALGTILHYGESHAIGEQTQRSYYINNLSNEDILIFGSSRALNHYNPRVFEDSLGLTTYNCGENETGIVCFYPKLNLIKERYVPKVIIYDVYSPDLLDSLRFYNIDYLKSLKTSYGKTFAVDSMFWRYDSLSRYKMLSKLYQYNSHFLDIILDNMTIISALRTKMYYKGFYLLNKGQMRDEPFMNNKHHRYVYDIEKLHLIEKLILENKDLTRLYFVSSPVYGATNDEMFDPIKKICNKYNIPFLNYYCDTTFTLHKEYFVNHNHLNTNGAKVFSAKIVHQIH